MVTSSSGMETKRCCWSYHTQPLQPTPGRKRCAVGGETTRPGKHTKSYGKWPFIMDFPMKNGGSFHSYVNLPGGNLFDKVSTSKTAVIGRMLDHAQIFTAMAPSQRRAFNEMDQRLIVMQEEPTFIHSMDGGGIFARVQFLKVLRQRKVTWSEKGNVVWVFVTHLGVSENRVFPQRTIFSGEFHQIAGWMYLKMGYNLVCRPMMATKQ